MSLEYAPSGFIGLLTPQANTTVEPECGILVPREVGLLTARLVSPQPSLEARLVDYFETLESSVQQFGAAPLRALGFACTGSSYLIGRKSEDEMLERLAQRLGCPVSSSARAVVDALGALQARRIALVSPYPDNLTQLSIGYWQSRGFEVGPVAQATGDPARGGHPIYGLGSEAAVHALAGLRGQGPFDAVVMLGTGVPTLRAILSAPHIDGAPVLSCTLALAWRCVCALRGVPPDAASLQRWIAGSDWRERCRERTRSA